MNLALRLGALGATGVVVAGLAQAGWWALLATVGDAVGLWWPLALQLGVTLAIAAAVGWQIHVTLGPLQRSLKLVREQAFALQEGRSLVVTEPVMADLAPAVAALNAAMHEARPAAPAMPAIGGEALRRLRREDPDTGFDSRFTFLRRLTERLAAADAPATSLLVLGLVDGTEDEALTTRAATLVRRQLRSVPDAFAGRLSTGELALCLPRHAIVAPLASTLMAEARPGADGLPCVIAAVDRLGGTSLACALDRLDDAMAEARAGGAGRVEVVQATAEAEEPRMPHAPNPDLAAGAAPPTPADITEALRQGRTRLGEFPVLDPYGQLLHLECPMRLRLDPDGPLEPADRWLHLAAAARATAQVDLAALDLALAACADDGVSRCVHVAAESLAAAEFVHAVRARLVAAPEAASRLCIEISEVSFERLPPALRNAGTVWRRSGVRLGVEHAGAALRSLVRLGELELDYVKVDPAFVRGLATDGEQRDWARGMVAFVHEFGAAIYAEGVDAAADLQAVWEVGFDGATGRAVTAWHRENLSAGEPSTIEP